MIYSAIETGAKFGMMPMDRALSLLVIQNQISFEVAAAKAHDKEGLKKLCNMVG